MAGRLAAHRGDVRAWPASCSPPTLGWLGRLGRAAPIAGRRAAGLLPPQPHRTCQGGRGEGRGCGRVAEGNGTSAKQSRLLSPLQFVTGMGTATVPH